MPACGLRSQKDIPEHREGERRERIRESGVSGPNGYIRYDRSYMQQIRERFGRTGHDVMLTLLIAAEYQQARKRVKGGASVILEPGEFLS